MGYTTYLVSGVWVGNDDNSSTLKVTGGSLPVAIWRDVMESAHRGLMPEPLPGEQGGDEMVADTPRSKPRETDVTLVEDKSGGGLLESLGGLFSGSTQRRTSRQKEGGTAFQRSLQNRDSH